MANELTSIFKKADNNPKSDDQLKEEIDIEIKLDIELEELLNKK